MDDLRVDPATLDRIAERLDRAATAALDLPVPSATPSAGPCTGAVAAVMSGYLDAYSVLADGLGRSAAGVRENRAAYLDVERRNADLLRGSTD